MKQFSSYEKNTHSIGKAFSIFAIFIIMSIPIAIFLHYKVSLPIDLFLKGLASILVIYLPISIIEFFTYVPMLGTGSAYLMFVTGNLSNLKVPCALNALEVAEVEPASEEADIISTMSVATSAIVTDLIIIIGVVGASFIQPILQSAVARPAMTNVLPALFGALGVIWIRKYWRIAIIPCILMLIAFIFVDATMLGIMIPVAAIIAIVCARFIYMKSKK